MERSRRWTDVSDPDAQKRSEPWEEEEATAHPDIPPDAPEADVLDQSRPAGLEDDDRER